MKIYFEVSTMKVAIIPDHMVGDIRKAFQEGNITQLDDLSEFDPEGEIEYDYDDSEMEEGATITLEDGKTYTVIGNHLHIERCKNALASGSQMN